MSNCAYSFSALKCTYGLCKAVTDATLGCCPWRSSQTFCFIRVRVRDGSVVTKQAIVLPFNPQLPVLAAAHCH